MGLGRQLKLMVEKFMVKPGLLIITKMRGLLVLMTKR